MPDGLAPIYLAPAALMGLCAGRQLVDAVRQAFIDNVSGALTSGRREVVTSGTGAFIGTMPAVSTSASGIVLAAKVVAFDKGWTLAQSHPGVVLVFTSGDSGPELTALEADTVTGLRTAAASVVAAELARDTITSVGVVGTGQQAYHHLRLFGELHPGAQLLCHARSDRTFARLAERLSHLELVRRPLPALLEESDVLCTLSAATEPLIRSPDLPSTIHINAMGASRPGYRELSSSVFLAASTVWFDSYEAARLESSEVQQALVQNRPPTWTTEQDIGHALAASALRTTGLSIFKSVGFAGLDLAAAAMLVDLSRRH